MYTHTHTHTHTDTHTHTHTDTHTHTHTHTHTPIQTYYMPWKFQDKLYTRTFAKRLLQNPTYLNSLKSIFEQRHLELSYIKSVKPWKTVKLFASKFSWYTWYVYGFYSNLTTEKQLTCSDHKMDFPGKLNCLIIYNNQTQSILIGLYSHLKPLWHSCANNCSSDHYCI